MKTFKVAIKRVEYYSGLLLVEAENETEAQQKAEKAWADDVNDDYIYGHVTDCMDDAETTISVEGTAGENDRFKAIMTIK